MKSLLSIIDNKNPFLVVAITILLGVEIVYSYHRDRDLEIMRIEHSNTTKALEKNIITLTEIVSELRQSNIQMQKELVELKIQIAVINK